MTTTDEDDKKETDMSGSGSDRQSSPTGDGEANGDDSRWDIIILYK